MRSYIIFKGINSLDIKGLYIQTFPLPEPSLAARRVNKVPIPGRNGSVRTLQQDEYGQDLSDDGEFSLTLIYKGDDTDFIGKWLNGDGDLILSNHPDRYLRAHIDNAIPIEKLLIHNLRTFTVTFSHFPYSFLKSGDTPIEYNPTENTWETIIMNDYSLSLPHLKIYGQGDIGVMVNGVDSDFYSVDGYIECDSELQQCYKDGQNLGMNMSGQFPALYTGKNIIEFTGNINQVILTPRWRI